MPSKISDKVLVIAHRGYTRESPENTLSAMEGALRLGVDGIETDIQLTGDDSWIVFHDENGSRLCHSPLVIKKTPKKKIDELRVKGEKIPSLEELLDLVRDRCLLNLEIKSVRLGTRPVQNLAKILSDRSLAESIILSAFHPWPLLQLRYLVPHIRRGFLYVDPSPLHTPLVSLIHPYSCHAFHKSVDETQIQRGHAQQRKFFAWTVNEEDDMRRLIRWGVDGIITDHPDRLLGF